MSEPVILRTEAGDEPVDLAEFEARVRRGEVSPQCLVSFPPVTGSAFVQASEIQLFQRLYEPGRAHFTRAFRLSHFPWITSLLIAVNLGVYVWTARHGPLDVDDMVRLGGKVKPLVLDLGEVWRLFTANFLHRDALHVGLNMFVLFNVGGALENVYRRLDYLFLLAFAGVASMASSLWLSDAVTVGASGMVYGALGGVVMFGLKYRSLLPPHYRRILGEAAIPTVLVFLWIGWTSAGVDNAAHFGGLFAGLMTTPFLRPRLLVEPQGPLAPAARAAPTLGLIAVVLFGRDLFSESFPPWVARRDDALGIELRVPATWKRGANRLGQVAYYNDLPGLGRATFAAGVLSGDDIVDPAAAAQRFTQESLRPAGLGPDVLEVVAEPPIHSRIADRDAILVVARVEESFGTTRLWAYFVPRGELVYQLVFSYPVAFERYHDVVERMMQGIRLGEPRSLREARAQALLFPQAAPSLLRLGEALRRVGEPHAAAEALRAAVRQQPSLAVLRSELALALFASGDVDEACTAARAAVLYAPEDASALEADARCALARGDATLALSRVREARKRAPEDERLRAAEERLRALVTE